MAQLHCYVPDDIADLFKKKAKKARLSTSKYLALLVKMETSEKWPDHYFDLVGSWEGEPLQRPESLDLEKRNCLE
ncbi:MAG TPA: hypothetical protein VJ943_16435 [Desulfotignum sp.]|nr:hypothetical protein [Desulfotignum sp.]